MFLKTYKLFSFISMLEDWFSFVYRHIRIIQLRFENQQVRNLVQKLLLDCTFKNSSAVGGICFIDTMIM